MEFNRRWWIH